MGPPPPREGWVEPPPLPGGGGGAAPTPGGEGRGRPAPGGGGRPSTVEVVVVVVRIADIVVVMLGCILAPFWVAGPPPPWGRGGGAEDVTLHEPVSKPVCKPVCKPV